MHQLKAAYGLLGDFKGFTVPAKASMLRTVWKENSWEGALAYTERAEQLKQAYQHTTFFTRSRQWAEWYTRALVQQMA